MKKNSFERFCADSTILVDTREQTPFFDSTVFIGGKFIRLKVERTTLKTGDYSLKNLCDKIAIERKSRTDFWQSITRERERFEREVERLSDFKYKCVVVEGTFDSCIAAPLYGRKIPPLSVSATVASWNVKHGVPFYFLRGRQEAEIFTLQTLYFVLKLEEKGGSQNGQAEELTS